MGSRLVDPKNIPTDRFTRYLESPDLLLLNSLGLSMLSEFLFAWTVVVHG